jgi:hypothetical protein
LLFFKASDKYVSKQILHDFNDFFVKKKTVSLLTSGPHKL